MSKQILHLTIIRKWFDLIALGKKTVEFREIKPYWTKRLRDKEFDEVHFRNGYSANSPFMRLEWQRTALRIPSPHDIPYTDDKRYCIYLGKILEIKNWSQNEIS